MRKKTLGILLCAIGVLALAYGLIKDDNVVFVIGVLFAVGGYVILRSRLKESIRNKT